jgi:alpha-tubulin suppressor-like RCC1 family protein
MENQHEVRQCPFCGEEILAIAKKCKHCQSFIEEEPVKEAQGTEAVEIRKTPKSPPPLPPKSPPPPPKSRSSQPKAEKAETEPPVVQAPAPKPTPPPLKAAPAEPPAPVTSAASEPSIASIPVEEAQPDLPPSVAKEPEITTPPTDAEKIDAPNITTASSNSNVQTSTQQGSKNNTGIIAVAILFAAAIIVFAINYSQNGSSSDAYIGTSTGSNTNEITNQSDTSQAEQAAQISEPGTEPVSISGGYVHSLLLLENGDVYSFGLNSDGQLGHGYDDYRLLKPKKITSFSNARAIAAGTYHTLVLLENGDVYSFGDNSYGQLGLDDKFSQYLPEKITALQNVMAITAGECHTLVLLENGDVYSFGDNRKGQLGHGDEFRSYWLPEKITTLRNAMAITAGSFHTLVLLENGDVYSFGHNSNGQLGHGDEDNRSLPTKITSLSNAKAIAAGGGHSLVLLKNGDVYSFGNNSYGQLGHGDKDNRSLPTKIKSLSNVKAISAGSNHSLLLLENGDVYSFGHNSYGQLGHGCDDIMLLNPTKITSLSNVKSIAAVELHTLLLLENGDVYSFGINEDHQLGLGDQYDRYYRYCVPKKIDLLFN